MITNEQAAIEKRLHIVNTLTGAAIEMAAIFSKPISGLNMTRKRAFPNRYIPARLKRQIKAAAKREMDRRTYLAMQLAWGSGQSMHLAQMTPLPPDDYAPGGITFKNE